MNSFRVAQNCGTRAFFATHQDTSTLNVFTWDEGKAAPVQNAVEVARWIPGNYRSVTPDGRTWLDRADPRLTGATLAGTGDALAGRELYFAWAVNANSNHRPQPFVQIARIDAENLTLLENINVFDPDSATCYGALSTNAAGEVGISYMVGGGPKFPSHVVGILTGTRQDVIVADGERTPLPDPRSGNGEWGDYLTVRPVFQNKTPQNLFAATGYTMKGAGDGSNRDCTPCYVVFGRASDAGAVLQPPVAAPARRPATPRPAPPVRPKPPVTPPADGSPIADVNTLSIVSPAAAAKIKNAAQNPAANPIAALMRAAPALALQDVPGTERWPVKTGQDPDRAKVGKNVIGGVNLGAGIVETTIEELVNLPRPPGLEDASKDPPQFKDVRGGITEVTIWRIDATIIALKHEHDGDYHLVLQAADGQQMVGEIPTPTTLFVGDSPWISNIAQARQAIDDKLVKHLSPAAFALMNDKYVPQSSLKYQPRATADPALSFVTPPEGSGITQPLFQTAITPTLVRLTGVGFFDRAHGATGAAPNVIELHPVLKVEWV